MPPGVRLGMRRRAWVKKFPECPEPTRVTDRKGKRVFSTGGYSGSIPPFLGHKLRHFHLAEPFRVAHILVTPSTHADQITLELAAAVCVVHIQRQIRTALHVVYVVYHLCPAVPSFCFAHLTFMPIDSQNICTKRSPLARNIERMDITCCNQRLQPIQEFSRHVFTQRKEAKGQPLASLQFSTVLF